MVFQKVLSSNSDESNWNQVNDLATEVRSKDVVQIFKDDIDATRRVLLGKGADGFYGLKVSPPGVDVYTATDDELVFNSNQNVFKIVSSGTQEVTKPINTTDELVTVAHGLSYTPGFMAYTNESGLFFNVPSVVTVSTGVPGSGVVTIYYTAKVYVDATNIYFLVDAGNGTGYTPEITVTFKYYLLQETAS